MVNYNALDPALGLAHCQHKKALYDAVLQSFYSQHHELLQRQSLASEPCQQLAHSIKSTALACGAERLHQLACELAPPANAPSEAQCAALLQAVQDVLHSIAEQGIVDLQDSSLHRQFVQALEQHNLSAVSLFKVWAEEAAADCPSARLAQIEEALAAFDFERALKLVDNT